MGLFFMKTNFMSRVVKHKQQLERELASQRELVLKQQAIHTSFFQFHYGAKNPTTMALTGMHEALINPTGRQKIRYMFNQHDMPTGEPLASLQNNLILIAIKLEALKNLEKFLRDEQLDDLSKLKNLDIDQLECIQDEINKIKTAYNDSAYFSREDYEIVAKRGLFESSTKKLFAEIDTAIREILDEKSQANLQRPRL